MPRRFERTVEITAPASRVWFVMSDVEAMPSWSPSMTSVVLDPSGPLAVGSTALIEQPKLSPTTWTVTEIVHGESFTWRSRAVVGTTATARHAIRPVRSGIIEARLTMEFSGPTSWLTGFLARRITRRYLSLEAEGLKGFCEATRRGQRR